MKDVKDALNSFGGDELSVDDRSVKEGSNGDAGQGPINVQCHNMPSKRFAVFPVRQTGALAAVAGQTTTAAIKKDEAQERIEAPHSRAGRRLPQTGRVGHRGFHGAGERKRASLKLFCAAPFLVRLVPQKECGRRGVESWCFFIETSKQ